MVKASTSSVRFLGFVVGMVSVLGLACSDNTPPLNDGGTDKAAPSADSPTEKTEVAADLPVDVLTLPPITLTVSDATVKVKEGDMTGTTFTVSLSRGSAIPIALMVATGDDTVATVDHDTVNFDSNDTGPKTITVFGTDDLDTVDNSTKLTLSAPGVTMASVLVQVVDDDVQAIQPVQSQTTLTEGGNGVIGVRLAFDPLGPVNVTLASGDSSRLTLGQATVTFTSQNYFIPQQVTVNALEDDDTENNTVTINLTAPGITAAAIAVTIIDNDVQNFDSTGSVMLTEGGPADVISVKLTKKPDANVVVTVSVSDPTKADIGATSLTFTPDNAQTAQAFTVTAKDDLDTNNEQITVTLHADAVMNDRVIPVSIKDDDSQALVITPSTGVTLIEGGQAVKLNVRLMFKPSADVSVNIFSSNTAKVSVDQNTLTFSSTNFDTPQGVLLTGLVDDDIVDDSAKVTFTSSGASSVSVPVTVKDKDKQGIVLVAPAASDNSLEMEEPADGAQPRTVMLGVRLAFRPPTPVSVTLLSSDETRLTLSKTTTPPSTTLVFDDTNFNVAQFIIMTPVHDTDIKNDTVNVTASSPDVTPPAVLKITIFDADTENFTLPAMVTVNEPAVAAVTNATVAVKLALDPGRQVPVLITSGDPSRVLFGTGAGPGTSTTMIYLIDTNPTSVPIIVMNDADAADNTVVLTIDDTTVGASKIPSRTTNVLITDIDKLNYVVKLVSPIDPPADPVDPTDPTKNRLLVNEAGANSAATFTVTLSADPVKDVTLTVVPLVSNVINIDKSTLTFVAGTGGGANNWNVAHVVTVSGIHDPNLLDEFPTIRISGLSNGTADALVTVHQKDIDSQSLVVSETSLVVTDIAGPNHVRTFNVSLDKQPPSSVTVNIVVPTSLSQSIVVSPTTLQFTNSNYNMAVPVTVTGVIDENTDVEADNISVSLPSQAATPVQITTEDHDQQEILISGTGLAKAGCDTNGGDCATLGLGLEENKQAANQGGVARSKSLNVVLLHPPHGGAAMETISVTLSNPTKINEASNLILLTFSSAKNGSLGWNLPQTITIASVADDDVIDEAGDVKLSSQNLKTTDSWSAIDQVINVTVSDKDLVMIDVKPHVTPAGQLSVNEDGTVTMDVKLLNQPPGNFQVDISSGDTSHATTDHASLTFSNANFGMVQSFKIAGVTDADGVDNSVTFTLSSATARAGAAVMVPVNVVDTIAAPVDAGTDGGDDSGG
ncbi:MAG TPA: hypothetical protein VH374_03995 [Polyangia bacterium]|nr:hypothetical protein [Polyangia bacterium]